MSWPQPTPQYGQIERATWALSILARRFRVFSETASRPVPSLRSRSCRTKGHFQSKPVNDMISSTPARCPHFRMKVLDWRVQTASASTGTTTASPERGKAWRAGPITMIEAIGMEVPRAARRDVRCFRDNALLEGISAEIYAELEDKIQGVEYLPNEIIFEENDAGNSLFLIAEGSVKISKKGRAGQQETLAYLTKNDFFGEMALVDVGKRSAQAVAVENVIAGR